MFPSTTISTSPISISEEPSFSSETRTSNLRAISPQPKPKKKRTKPGNPDPDAEVVALSPRSLLITNRFVCEICNKGFQRDQNLQLHRRGHNLPWCLRQRTGNEAARKRVYVCPEPSCVHHHPSRALGDLTGIKKHFCRKHGEKKWKCDKCFKKYAVFSDWKAHAKTCGTKEYRCDCGTPFSRKDSFITHRAFCDALAEESARMIVANADGPIASAPLLRHPTFPASFSDNWDPSKNSNPNHVINDIYTYPIAATSFNGKQEHSTFHPPLNPYLISGHHLHSPSAAVSAPHLSAAALLQGTDPLVGHRVDRLTRNFLGVESSDMPGREELIPMHGLGRLDLVTAGSGDNEDRGGGHAGPFVGFGFPPAAGAWGGF